MRILVVFLIFLTIFSCKKEKCYDCVQVIKITCNKDIKGYPVNTKTPLVSCGDNIDIVDDPKPIIFIDTLGDTIYTYWKDTDCKEQGLF